MFLQENLTVFYKKFLGVKNVRPVTQIFYILLYKDSAMKKLLLIDGNSLINRAYYATPPMSTSSGTPTNAVMGFINMLLKLTTDEKPDYLLVAFDRKEPTFRHKMYDMYKGTRKPMPEDLVPQVDLLKKTLDALNICRYEQAGIEADDIIGTLSHSFKDVYTEIVTGDKDSFQLVGENVSVLFTKRGISDLDVLDLQNFTEKTELTSPLRVIDLKALMGDGSDNIPGVPGVGEKTAKSLLVDFGTVERVYENIENVKGKLKEKLLAGKDLCLLSKKLATIDRHVAIDKTLDEMTFSYPFPYAAKRMFIELEFRNLSKKDIFEKDEAGSSAARTGDDYNNGNAPANYSQKAQSAINITDKSQLNDVFLKQTAIYFSDDIHLYSCGNEYVIPIKKSFFDEGYAFDEAVKTLKEHLENENNKIILYSSKDVRHMLSEYGVSVKAYTDDVSLQKYIADPYSTANDAETAFEQRELPVSHPAFSLFCLHEILTSSLKENGQFELYKDIELPLSYVLFDMENEGFKVDEDKLSKLNEKYKKEIASLTEKILSLAGENFNPNSPKQLSHILFEKLNLSDGKKKKNPSTSAEVLEELSDKHEIIPLILKYRKVSKLNSTYIEGFKPLIDKKTGLIHTVFNQTLTTTGRLSSKEPNLQNLPVRDEDGKEIRECFVPSDSDHILVGADYSQIELRLLAHFSKCEKLISAYNRGDDIHALTASHVFGVPLDSVTPQMRRKAKAVNFGIIYGISEYGLAKNIKCSPKEAKDYISKYFENYPEVKEYMNSNVEFARKNGYVSTLCGRKRYIRDINSPNFNLRSFSERAAMNMPLQGSSADIIKIAMIKVYDRLKNENLSSKLILQIHDELIINTLSSEKEKVEVIIKEEMEGAAKLSVPLTADVYSGKNLAEAK